MKKRTSFVAVILLLFCVPALFLASNVSFSRSSLEPVNFLDADTIVLRLANDLGKDHISSQACDKFAELVKARSGGRILIFTYHGEQLGDQASAADQVWFGGVDFARVNLMSLEEMVPAVDAFAVPCLFDDSAALWSALDNTPGRQLDLQMAGNGYIPIFYEDAGTQSIYSVRPIRTLQDVEGMRIGIPENSVMKASMEALGAVPVSLPQSEIYDAVQNGVIDGAIGSIVSYFQANLDEVAPYYAYGFQTRAPDVVVASKITFSKLSLEDRNLIQECGREAGFWQRHAWADAEQTYAAENEASTVCIETLKDPMDWMERVEACCDEMLTPDALSIFQEIRSSQAIP